MGKRKERKMGRKWIGIEDERCQGTTETMTKEGERRQTTEEGERRRKG